MKNYPLKSQKKNGKKWTRKNRKKNKEIERKELSRAKWNNINVIRFNTVFCCRFLTPSDLDMCRKVELNFRSPIESVTWFSFFTLKKCFFRFIFVCSSQISILDIKNYEMIHFSALRSKYCGFWPFACRVREKLEIKRNL